MQSLNQPESAAAFASPAVATLAGQADIPPAAAAVAEPETEEQRVLKAYLSAPAVLIEISSRCNFACGYCSSAFKERAKVDMSLELFQHIAPQLPGLTRKAIRLHIDGEPTMHPHFLEIAALVNRQGLRVALATNGSLLDPSMLSIEMDVLISASTTPEELAQRHRHLNYEKYISRIQDYVRAWLKTPTKQCLRIQVPFALGQVDDAEYRRAKDDHLARFMEAVGLPPPQGSLHEKRYGFGKSKDEVLEMFPWHIVGEGLYPVDGKRLEYLPLSTGFCDSPWNRLAVLATGEVACCCVDLSGGTAFTKPYEILEKPLQELWLHHPRITAIRRAFLNRRVGFEVCRRCLAAYGGELRHDCSS